MTDNCTHCGSGAINPHLHGRDEDADLDLCDVCYWRERAVGSEEIIERLRTELAHIKELGRPLAEVTDVGRLRADVEFLWQLLDDIDTASDMAKDNDEWYRARVEIIQGKRHQRITSDGYSLFLRP